MKKDTVLTILMIYAFVVFGLVAYYDFETAPPSDKGLMTVLIGGIHLVLGFFSAHELNVHGVVWRCLVRLYRLARPLPSTLPVARVVVR